MTKQYVQCHLRRDETHTTAWIEERGAKPGASVEVLPDGGMWEVVEVFKHNRLPEDALREIQMLNRKSLPSIEPMGR